MAHPNKHIREAIEFAEQNGWTFVKAGPRSHLYGRLYCPRRDRGGHIFGVQSTPRVPEHHANAIRKAVRNCDHGLDEEQQP